MEDNTDPAREINPVAFETAISAGPIPEEIIIGVGQVSTEEYANDREGEDEGRETENSVPAADELPSLVLDFTQAERSLHLHTYDESRTAESHVRQARQTPEAERTAAQNQLLEDVAVLREIAPFAYMYQELYTPSEVRSLVAKLTGLQERLTQPRPREGVEDIEKRVADFVLNNKERSNQRDSGIYAIMERSQMSGSPSGITWNSLARGARVALMMLHDTMWRTEGGEGRKYIVDLELREGGTAKYQKGKTDVGVILQFVASMHGQDVITDRINAVYEGRCQTFQDNCAAINKWYELNRPIIERLPDNLKGDQVSIRWELHELISTMNRRQAGQEITGKYKRFTNNPLGAISLQRKIQFLVESAKKQLGSYVDPAELEIEPLPPQD